MMETMASNVAQFPPRREQRKIVEFGDGFLEGIFYGGEWKSLARAISERKQHLSPNIHPFIEQMKARTRRPTINQLSMMAGLIIQAMTRERLLGLEANGTPNSADVVSIGRK